MDRIICFVFAVLLCWPAIAGAADLTGRAPVSGPGATGRFVAHTDGKFYDPTGDLFIPRGVNLFPGAISAAHQTAVACWRFNFIRLDVLLNKAGTDTLASEAQIDAFIDAYTAIGIVVMVDWHKVGGYMDGAAQRSAMLAYFDRLATKYKDNAYVWYGGYNEPGGNEDVRRVDGQWEWKPDRVAKWVDMSRAIIRTIRAAGATAPVSVPSMVLAQDILAGDKWNYAVGIARAMPERSASAKFGDQVRAGFDNTFVEIHLYGNYDHPERKAQLAEYFAWMQAAGWPVLVGEMGSNTEKGDKFDSALNRVALRAQFPHVGDVFWHGDHGGQNKLTLAPGTKEGIAQLDDCNNPTNLTRAGKAIWDGTHPGAYPPGTY